MLARYVCTTADGIERRCELSVPLLDMPPPGRLYPSRSLGPNSIHRPVTPNAWRLPFESAWRDPVARAAKIQSG